MNSRFQLTLFVSGAAAQKIEDVRKILDPVQHNLIPAHVTLCREDELQDLEFSALQERLATWEAGPINLSFGAPEPFSTQGSTHGILLPCIRGAEEFQALRHLILGSTTARHPLAHITLAHPRNPKAAGNTLAAASDLEAGLKVTFGTVCRIRQDGHTPWCIVERFDLPVADDRAA